MTPTLGLGHCTVLVTKNGLGATGSLTLHNKGVRPFPCDVWRTLRSRCGVRNLFWDRDNSEL